MDVSQITSLATGLDNLDLKSQVNTLVLKKVLDNQQSSAASILESIPQLPANPAIGRNINTTVEQQPDRD
ncbi:YjfB family protein [Erwiniaceae bacterium L1_54_6]|nr:YjfB family protein [Erwiniaceae bacterium L1_54_6]